MRKHNTFTKSLFGCIALFLTLVGQVAWANPTGLLLRDTIESKNVALTLKSILPSAETPVKAGEFVSLNLFFTAGEELKEDIPALAKLTLMDEHGERAITHAQDPVVARFWGQKEVNEQEKDSPTWPSEMALGYLIPNRIDGRIVEWLPLQRRMVGVFPRSAGRYTVRITLSHDHREQHFSAPLIVTGQRVIGEGLFGFNGSTLRILAEKLPHEKALNIETQIQSALAEHQNQKVAEILGREMRALFPQNPIHTLGRYVSTLADSAVSNEGLILFLEPFLSGFRRHGVVLIAKDGVQSYRVLSSRGLVLSNAPDTVMTTPSRARVFESENLIVIPYRQGETLTLHVESNPQKPFSAWDIVPGKVHSATELAPSGQLRRFVIQPQTPTFPR